MTSIHDGPDDVLLAALAHRDRWELDRVASFCDESSAASFFREYCDALRPLTKEDFPQQFEDTLMRSS